MPTVSVAAAAASPLIVMLEDTEQLGRSIAPIGEFVSEHERLTAPVKPFAGVTVIVDVFPVVAPAEIVIDDPLRENDGGIAATSIGCEPVAPT